MKKGFILLISAVALCATSFAQTTPVVQITTATSGTVTVINTQQNVAVIHDAGLTVSLTLALPTNPLDGQIVTFCSSGGVTTVTITAVVGTVVNLITSLASGGSAAYMYSVASNKWYKLR